MSWPYKKRRAPHLTRQGGVPFLGPRTRIVFSRIPGVFQPSRLRCLLFSAAHEPFFLTSFSPIPNALLTQRLAVPGFPFPAARDFLSPPPRRISGDPSTLRRTTRREGGAVVWCKGLTGGQLECLVSVFALKGPTPQSEVRGFCN